MAYRIKIERVDDGASEEGGSIRQTSGNNATPTTGETRTTTVVQMSEAQRNGLFTYIGLLQRGATTSSIETAIIAAE